MAIVFALVVLACGIDKGKLESAIKDESNKQLAGQSIKVTSVSCVRDGDDLHYSCLVIASDNSRLIMKATCDDSGQCVWRPE
jgi:hypothetical protein